jgi:Ca2+-binding EF-hand superfamily protein
MEYDYKEINNCELCGKPFGMTRVRHKCKRCHLIICSDCGVSKAIILVEGEKPGEPHRVCNPCTNDINFQKEFERNNETSWNTTSRVAQEWYDHALYEGSNDDYEQQLLEAENIEEIAKTIEVIKQELSLGKFDKFRFNYSILEFMHYSQQKTDRDYARVHIENVLKAFHARTRVVYNNIIPSIVAFLLTVASESRAYTILCYLHEKVLPFDFWNRASKPIPFEGFQREKWVLRRLIDDKFSFTNETEKHFFLKNFNKNIDILLGGLMINSCAFSIVIHAWSEMIFNRSFRHLENFMFKLLWGMKPFLEKNPELTIRNFQLYSCRNFTPQILIDHKGEFTAEDKGILEFEWDEKGKPKTLERVQNNHFAYIMLKSLSLEQLRDLYMELGKLTEELKAKLSEKTVRETIDLNKRTFSVLFEGAVSNVSEQQAGIVFDALDVNEAGVIGSRRLICIILALITQGDLENKISEIFKMKDQMNRGSIDIAPALQIIDWLGDVLTFINEIDQTLNFRAEWYDLNDKLVRKLRSMKNVGVREITVTINDHPLRNLFLDPNQRDIFAFDFKFQVEHTHQKRGTLMPHESTLEEKLHRQEELKKILEDEAKLLMEEKIAGVEDENARFEREADGMNEQSTLSSIVSHLSAVVPDEIKEQVVEIIEDKAKEVVFEQIHEIIHEKTGLDVNVEKTVEIIEDKFTHEKEVVVVEEKQTVVAVVEEKQPDINQQINQSIQQRNNNANRQQKPEDTGSCKVCSIF